MRQNLTKLIKPCLIVYFLILILFLGHIIFFSDMYDFLRAWKDAESRDYTAGWKLESGEYADLNDISAGKFGGTVVLSKVLPESMEETDSIYFSTSNLNFNVYVDDEPIYSYHTVENLTGTGDGVSYHMIGLGTKDQNSVIRIVAESSFPDGHGGRINEMQYGPEELYRYSFMSRNNSGYIMSVLMIIIGVVGLAFYLGLFRKNPIMRTLWALGVSAVLFGIWSLVDTGVPQLLTGNTYASREMSYFVLHLAAFPMVFFIYSKTKQLKRIYPLLSFLATIVFVGWLLVSRFVFGVDMHSLVGPIYLSYGSQLLIIAVMLTDNELFCRKRSISSSMAYFYSGAGIFVATALIDMGRFLFGKKGSVGHGTWFRLGMVIFLLFMCFQVFEWWSMEKTSLERDRFINHLLQHMMDGEDPDIKIGKVLEYLCRELHADRAYIFEDMKDGTFDNTYEFVSEGVTPEIDNLKGLPYDGVIDVWYEEYKKGGHILIYDLEKYRDVSENMYQVLKPQDIRTLVTGPLILDGEYIGFFGVDNPPTDMMKEISEIIRLLMYFLSELIASRDNHRRLLEFSYMDSLTGVGNRRAVREFETTSLDTSVPYGFVMCDINGLKAVNDNAGHDAGDELIKNIASVLVGAFGRENVYRMGGDEFAAYACGIDLQELENRISRIRKAVSEKGYHVAIGYSFAPEGDPNYNSHKTEADNRMYEEKREFYRSGGQTG